MDGKKLPIWKLGLKNGGIDFVALVNEPATQENWIAMSKQHPLKFLATDADQHIVSGPIMVADLLIFRRDPDHGEHYVYYDADTIKNTVLNFFQRGLTAKVNLMHLGEAQTDDIFMFESFLIDSKRGIATPKGFDELPDGSWFGSYKVNNEAVWNEFIKTGELKGFSVEGFFAYEPNDANESDLIKKISNILEAVE